MKIYLASTAPGNEIQRERGMLNIETRLLSYFHIKEKLIYCSHVFKAIKREKKK